MYTVSSDVFTYSYVRNILKNTFIHIYMHTHTYAHEHIYIHMNMLCKKFYLILIGSKVVCVKNIPRGSMIRNYDVLYT